MIQMTHLAPTSDADLELVSAYLDNQLTPAERTALEARFAQDAALRQACDELGATVALLRELTPVRPPRSFTLDPATVAPHRSVWQLPAAWMRLGSVFATLLFAITFAFSPSNGALLSNAPAASSTRAVPDGATGGAVAEGVTAAPAMAAESSAATVAPAAESAPVIAAVATADPAAMSAPAQLGDASAQRVITNTTTSSPDTTTIGTMQNEPPREVVPPSPVLSSVQIALAAAALSLLLGSFLVGWRMR